MFVPAMQEHSFQGWKAPNALSDTGWQEAINPVLYLFRIRHLVISEVIEPDYLGLIPAQVALRTTVPNAFCAARGFESSLTTAAAILFLQILSPAVMPCAFRIPGNRQEARSAIISPSLPSHRSTL
jgi:hypothetical protein